MINTDYLDLRTEALCTARDGKGLGVAIDYHFEYGLVTLLLSSDNTLRLLRCSGEQIDTSTPAACPDTLSVPLREAAKKHRALFQATTDMPAPPKVGFLSVTLLHPTETLYLVRSLKKSCRSSDEKELFTAINALLLHQLDFRETYFGHREIAPKRPSTTMRVGYLSPALITPLFSVYRYQTRTVRNTRVPLADVFFGLIKPSRKDYRSYRRTILSLPVPDTVLSAEEPIAYAAIVEWRTAAGLAMTVLRLSGTVDYLRESHRPAMGLDAERPKVTRAVRAFLREASSALPFFEKCEASPALPSAKETSLHLITNRGVYSVACPNCHPERCPQELLQTIHLFYQTIDTLHE